MSKAKRNPHIPRDRKRAVGAAIEAAIPQIAARVLARDASEALKAKADADAGKTMLQRQTERKAALKAKQDEIDRQVKEHLDATYDEDVAKAARVKQQMADDRQARKDREKKRRADAKLWRASENERKQSLENQRAEKAKKAQQKEAIRAGHVKTIIEAIGRVFRDDSLYEDVRKVKRLKGTTDAEHELLKTALLAASSRLREAAVPLRKGE